MKLKKIDTKTLSPRLIGGIVMVLMLSFSPKIQAQQDSQFTQYMYNTETINPAYAGSRGALNITGLYRDQWVGLDGSPKTLNFTVNSPVGDSLKVGLGLTAIQDKIGPSSETTLAADFSYTLQMNEDVLLAFGLKGGFNLLNVDYSLLNIYNPNDALQQFNIDNRLTPMIGLGLYLHNNNNWYAGLSVPNLLETRHYNDVTVSNASERATLYAIGGYVFDLSNSVKFKPAVLGKFVSGAPVSLDLSANFLFNEKFTLGAGYRLDAAVSVLAGFQISNSMMIGYAYDRDTSKLVHYNSGSHEIFLRFELSKIASNFLTPRFY